MDEKGNRTQKASKVSTKEKKMFRLAKLSRCAASAAALPLIFKHRGVGCIPHPEKAHRGGEDAFASSDVALGVADGVGGYSSSGINPAVFARRLMAVSLDAAEKQPHTISAISAIEVGNEAVRNVEGGCPATFATFVGPRVASVWSLGDCQVYVARNGAMLYESTSQQHYFNCPYQLPGDPPKRGLQARLEVQPGDVFLLASDGLLDNLQHDELLYAMKAAGVDPAKCVQLAKSMAERAIFLGQDATYVSPFAVAARKEGYRYVGGKLDDVTVVLAVVGEQEDAATTAAAARGKKAVRLIDELFPLK